MFSCQFHEPFYVKKHTFRTSLDVIERAVQSTQRIQKKDHHDGGTTHTYNFKA